MKTIEDKIIDVVSEQTGKNNITKDSTLKDLGCSDLDRVEICMHVEYKFKVELEDKEMNRVETVSDLIALVAAKSIKVSEAKNKPKLK